MTGGSAGAPAPQKRRFSLPTGRYRLSRLFFNFYLLTMGSFIAIAVVADFVITTALRDISYDYGTLHAGHRGDDRGRSFPASPQRLGQAHQDHRRALQLSSPHRRARRNRAATGTVNLLDAGELAVSPDGEIVYHRLKTTAQVLVIGPLSPERDPDNRRFFTLEMRIRILTWGLISFFLAIAVWLWVRPVWRDLEALRQTAVPSAKATLRPDAPAVNNTSFELLAETLNAMAERVQRLIATQKELSSAISHELRTPIARMRFALEMLAEADVREERERLWRMMEADLDELDNLIDSSLTYARFEREQPELQLSPTGFGPWLSEQVEDVRILGGKLAIDLDTAALPDDLSVALDRKEHALLPCATCCATRSSTHSRASQSAPRCATASSASTSTTTASASRSRARKRIHGLHPPRPLARPDH